MKISFTLLASKKHRILISLIFCVFSIQHSYSQGLGIGVSSPTAVIHLQAGTSAANSSPLKFSSGTNLTTPEAGAVEFDRTRLYYTTSTPSRITLIGNAIGITGGTTLIGGTSASENLILKSTSNTTKGKIILGTNSAYDEVNDRLGIGTTSPAGNLQVVGSIQIGAPSATKGTLIFNNASNANTVTLQPGTTSVNYTLTLPASQASIANSYLKNDGSGNLTWSPFTVTSSSSGTTITTTSTTDISAMSITIPTSGDYMIWFTSTVSNSANSRYIYTNLYSKGVLVTGSEVPVFLTNAADNGAASITSYVQGLNAGDVIDIRWRVSANTGSMFGRSFTIMKVN